MSRREPVVLKVGYTWTAADKTVWTIEAMLEPYARVVGRKGGTRKVRIETLATLEQEIENG